MQTSTAVKLHKWVPLLDEEQSHPLLVSIQEIADVLETKMKETDPASLGPELGEGMAALAVFFTYLHLSGLRDGAAGLAFQSLNSATEALATRAMGPSLYAGFTGIAWAAEHVTKLLNDSPEDLGSEIDVALEAYLGRSPWKTDYDLIVGLVGIGVYCLERGESPVARRCLELIVERLSELAEVRGNEICWFTSPSLLPPQQVELYPKGYYNLGLAHGIPGIIALLGRAQAAGIEQEKTSRLLEGSVRWLLNQRLDPKFNSSFPPFLVPEQKIEDCRLAWCYGDAGLAAALFLAARAVRNRKWEEEALMIARKAASREPENCQVKDVCVCHGSAGLAHIFNRFYHATREEIFSRSCSYWLDQTLQFRKPGTGAAGYLVLAPDTERTVKFQPRFGLIEGIAGVGLSLLAAISDVEPCWDRIFMVDIPPLPSQP